jgi:hypothetical protein
MPRFENDKARCSGFEHDSSRNAYKAKKPQREESHISHRYAEADTAFSLCDPF